jgi:predicted RND superfamily exporter protein
MIVGLQKTKKGALKNTRKSDGRLAHRFSEILTKRPYIILAAAVIIVGIAIFGIGKVWINSSFIDNFERDSDIVQTDAFINKNFGGTSTLNVIVEGKNENTMKGPTVLRILEQMQKDAESLDMVGTTFGLTDYLKRMNKVMHADNPVYDTIPDSQELIAQYLLLYEMSGDPENLWRVVDYDYKKGNITLQLKSDDSRTIKSAISVIEPYLDDLQQQGVDVHYAGSGYKGLVFTDLILKGQVSSLMLALGIVIILIALMFKKIVVGLIGSLPIVITAIINFGIMGLLRVPLSMTTALVSSIAIGVGIDYAIHFIERYREYARLTGDRNLTSSLTMHHTGRAILFNAVVVIAGFLVLLFSVFPPNRTLGALVSLNMFTSFLGTVTVMFLLLFLTDTYFKKDKRSM